jgi:hypothetical protein
LAIWRAIARCKGKGDPSRRARHPPARPCHRAVPQGLSPAAGVGIEEVRTTFDHDFKSLVDEASSRGLSLGKEEIDIAAILTEKESIRRSRYIETGYYQRPGLAALSRTCQGLEKSVSAALRDAGMSIPGGHGSGQARTLEDGL